MTGSIQSRGGGLPAYPPWGTHAVPRAFNKHKSPSDFISYLIKVQKGAVRESIPHQETAALLGRCRTRCCLSPTPIPSAVRNPYFIHNGKERAREVWSGVQMAALCPWKRRLVLPPTLPPSPRGGTSESFPDKCVWKEPAPGHQLQKHHGQRVQTSLCKYTSPTSRSSCSI